MMAEARLAVQLGLGVVFLFSTGGKLRDPAAFVRGVAGYRIVPRRLAHGFGMVLISLEGFLAMSHLSGWLLAAAVPLALGMLATFAVAVSVVLARGQELPCYCFGARDGERTSKHSLVRLLFLIVGEVLLVTEPALFTTSRFIYPHQVSNLQDLGLAVLWTVVLLLSGLWLFSTPDLVALVRQCKTCA